MNAYKNEIVNKIHQIRQDVKNDNPNYFFSLSNKEKQYQAVQKNIQFDQLLQASLHIIRDNHILVDFSILKLFANDSNYDTIIQHLIDNMIFVLDRFPTTVFHLNLNTISVTSCQRLKPLIQLFSERSTLYNKDFSEKTEKIYVYYTPSVISQIIQLIKPCINPVLHGRYVFYQKSESADLFQQLYS